MTNSIFPLTGDSHECPKCRTHAQMIQHMPIWVCPICRSAFDPTRSPETPAPQETETFARVAG